MGRVSSVAAIGWLAGLALLPVLVTCATPRPASKAGVPSSPASRAAGSATPPPVLRAQPEVDWVASAHPDLRRLTVLIRVKPPVELASKYVELAGQYKRLKPLFQAAAEGGFGSGFLVVRRERSDAGQVATVRRFIVTNRHVVDLATQVSVSFEGSPTSFEAPVVYIDPSYDLAVISLGRVDGSANVASLAEAGFDFEASPAKDQQPVVASGYPGIGRAPSYQVTRGYVSNERFEVTEGGQTQLYVQHTAPIDPGSSGGPLMTAEGKVLGVNTLKVRRRENVGLAVPAAVAAAAVARAALVAEAEAPPTSADAARLACDELVQALARGEPALGVVERAIGGAMVARDGFASLDELPRDGEDWVQAFIEAPSQVFLHAIALRLLSAMPSASDASGAASTCVPAVPVPEASTVSFNVRTRQGERAWTFGWEQRRWKLLRGTLSRARAGESFFRAAGGPSGPRKKWTPSLR